VKADTRIRIPFSTVVRMIANYAGVRLREQVKSVAFIVVYLIAFQVLIFGRAPEQSLRIAGGIAAVVLGLTLFLEGILLGLMPLAKRVGLKLPSRGGLKAIVPIGLVLGCGSTLAEPAVAALRALGGNTVAWKAPLLFFLLERSPELLILAIGIGVGVAVALGMLRFYVGFSIKPLLLTIVPVLLVASLLCARSPNLAAILGLAWDAGAVTTGAVTVPLVLALGIGLSGSSGKTQRTGSGFGIVALASALPVMAVLLLGVVLLPGLPTPGAEAEFLAPANRPQALRLFESEEALRRHALLHGSATTRAMFENEQANAKNSAGPEPPREAASAQAVPRFFDILRNEALHAAQAVLPLTALLGLALLFMARERPAHLDEVVLGIAFAFVGMTLLTAGIRIGLSPLGNDVGTRLPQVYRDVEVDRGQIVIEDFDPAIVRPAAAPFGQQIRVFHLYDGKVVRTVTYRPEWHDKARRVYTHRIMQSPLTHPELSRIGVLLILVFAFGMGYGTTIAEPALRAMGRTVEDISVGAVKGFFVVRAVSIGVGVGLVAGVVRILYDIPTVWMILPPYLLLLPLTVMSDEDFAGMAWDSGGVTTGVITVPLVLAMGLALGEQLSAVDGFGVLAMASVYPILAVLLFGMRMQLRQRSSVRAAKGLKHHV
jgi:hypothetical protein